MKGFWIPIELMNLDISWTKRILLAEISQLEMLDKGCIASNNHFADKLKLTNQGVSKALNELSKDGLIIIDNAQTKRNFGRKITINFSKSSINFSKSGINESGESKENKTINKTINNKKINKKETPALENRRDIIIQSLKETDLSLINKQSLHEWLEYKKYDYASMGINKLLKMLKKYDVSQQQQMVDTSIMSGYQGLFPPKTRPQYKTKQQITDEAISKFVDERYPDESNPIDEVEYLTLFEDAE